MFLKKSGLVLLIAACMQALISVSPAAVDTLSVIVNKDDSAGTASFSVAGYDPINDAIYAATFGATAELRRIYLGAIPAGKTRVTTIATATETQLFYRDGNTARSVSNPTQFGLVLNPKDIVISPTVTIPAYSFAMITDGANTQYPTPGTPTGIDPNASKKVYSYNLGEIPVGGDGRNIFTTQVTLQQMMTLSGVTATTANVNRQGAFSTSGQSFYFIESASNLGGVYRIPAAGGTVQKLLTGSGINTEPVALSNGTVDTIVFQGNGTNLGGLDKITYDTSNGATSTQQVFLARAALNDFLELPAAATSTDIRSMAVDAQGNIYFSNVDPLRTAMYKYDTNGRLSKVLSRAERADAVAANNANTLHMIPRTTQYVGTNGSFPITQIIYSETTPVNMVVGANIFKTGDFNRDNQLTAADINLLKGIDPTSGVQTRTLVTTRGVLMTANTTPGVGGNSGFTAADYKFDLNGNSVTDWKDIKILQPFFDFGNGDVDLNGVVDFADFQLIQNNYGLTGKTWFSGDLDGNDIVDFADFQILQNSFGYQSSVLTGFSIAAFDQAQWDSFVVAAIPEPSTCAALGGIAIVGLIARRRRSNSQSHCTGVAG